MLPSNAVPDAENELNINAHLACDGALPLTGSFAVENFLRLFFVEDCRPMSLSARPTMSPFGIHVSHVVGLRAEKQMDRIDACSVITGMQDVKMLRDLADEQFIGKPMDTVHLAANVELAIATKFRGETLPFDAAFVGFSCPANETVDESIVNA